MPFDAYIELVVDKYTGRLADCFALDESGERSNRIPITEARERFDVSGPGIVSFDIHVPREADGGVMLTQDDRLILIGLTSVVIRQRRDVDCTEGIIQKAFESHGVGTENARMWAGEVAYNEGDDPIAAVESALATLKLEVEPE